MTPGQYDFGLVRGTTAPFSVRLKARDENGDLVPLPFDDVRLSIYQRKTLLLRVSLENGRMTVADPVENEVRWTPTPEESRSLPVGPKARYELEVWNGDTQIVYLMGVITGIGGINDDELEP